MTFIRSLLAVLVLVILSACVSPQAVQHDVTPQVMPTAEMIAVPATEEDLEVTIVPVPESTHAPLDTSWNQQYSITKIEATPSQMVQGRNDYAIMVWNPATGESPLGLLAVDVEELARIPLQQLVEESKIGPIQACIHSWGESFRSIHISRVEPGFCGMNSSESASPADLLTIPVTVQNNEIVAMQIPERDELPSGATLERINFTRANLLSDGQSAKWVFHRVDGTYREFYGLRAQDVHFDILSTIQGIEFEHALCIEVATGEGIIPTVVNLQPFACH